MKFLKILKISALFFILALFLMSKQGEASSSPCSKTPNWMNLSPATSPSARFQASMAYDPINKQLILFGGSTDTKFFKDTWSWNGTTWSRLSPSHSPPARSGASMAYDPQSKQMILFGGLSSTGYLNDTWSWDGKTWTQLTPAISPAIRYLASMAYDPTNGEIILFGGYQIIRDNPVPSQYKFKFFNDTWSWNGKNWKKLSPAQSPSVRAGASMAYDPKSRQMILFGGGNLSTELRDTWNWDGTNWTKLKPSTSPPARSGATLAYDSMTQQLILFGGIFGVGDFFNDTWNWNGVTWTQLFPSDSPLGREEAVMAYDPQSRQLILFGGQNFITQTIFDDTWNWGISVPIVKAEPDQQTICSGQQTNIQLSSSLPDTTFTWTVVENNVSGATPCEQSCEDAIQQTLTATSNTPGTAIYTITPTANGCRGPSITVTVTVGSPIAPPKHFRGKTKIKFKHSAAKKEIIHVLTWHPSPDPTVTGYNLYQGEQLLRTIPATGPFKARLRHRSKHQCYTYHLVAFNGEGCTSPPVEITLPKKCK